MRSRYDVIIFLFWIATLRFALFCLKIKFINYHALFMSINILWWVIGEMSHRLNESSPLMSHHLSGEDDLGWWQTDFNICNIRIWFWSIVFWQDIWYFSCLISILLCHVIILTSRDGNGVANLWQIFKRNSFLTIFFSKQDNGYPDWFTNQDRSRPGTV